MSSRALQIVSNDASTNTMRLNLEDLRSIFTNAQVKDKYVSIISITGPYRQGKSFLLNFFLRYLRVKYVEQRALGDWLTPDDGKLEGFQSMSGSKRFTEGILMWSEVFFAKMLTGEEVAIFLMDTQGSFDNNSSMDDCAKIFALSTLISSVQIYNVMRNLKQYDFGHLQCFGGYGNLLTAAGDLPPFQNLCFLVRDWPFVDEHAYGEAGGQTYLEEVWQTGQEELKAEVDNVKSLFEKITCFLLPHPGRTVDGSKKFDGDLNDIDEDFKKYAQDLVTTFLSVDNLVLKTVNGEKIKASELMCFIEEYGRVLQDGALPKVETIFQATVEAHYKNSKPKAFKIYKKNMDADIKHSERIYNASDLYTTHHENKVTAIAEYTKFKTFNNVEIYEKYFKQLKDEIDTEFNKYKTINNEKIRRREEKRRQEEERKRQALERARRFQQSEAGSSGLSQMPSAETIGTAAAVIGTIAAVGFGLAKVFSSKNND